MHEPNAGSDSGTGSTADGTGGDVDGTACSRRWVLRAAGAGTSAFAIGTASAHGDEGQATTDYCAQTSTDPKMVPYVEGGMAACADDHPITRDLQERVATSFEENFPTVGALIDDGYVPYGDFFTATGEDGDGVSHWINPEYLGNGEILDPANPESIMVDHQWWRPLGVMFIATEDGQEIHPPPAVYEPDDGGESKAADACLPWHTHVGLPGRKSWLKYRTVYGDTIDALKDGVPCRTPWMLHIWASDHPHGVYAEGSLPRGKRGGPPAEPAGFETDAVPGEDKLDEAVLLDAAEGEVREHVETFERELHDVGERIDDLGEQLADVGDSLDGLAGELNDVL